ncbi:MAG: hypothetical protein EBR67_08805 [Proteobacteria bacterium]|nr:hypothetical protein [Pseudomonadota bacterium]
MFIFTQDDILTLKENSEIEPKQASGKDGRGVLSLRAREEACSGVHERLKDISSQHSADIAKALASLVKQKYLIPRGVRRGISYVLNKNFSSTDLLPSSPDLSLKTAEEKISELARKNKKLSQSEMQKNISSKQ